MPTMLSAELQLQHRLVLPKFFQDRFRGGTNRQLFMFGQGILLPIVCMREFDVSKEFGIFRHQGNLASGNVVHVKLVLASRSARV